jgi:hypothetical protein
VGRRLATVVVVVVPAVAVVDVPVIAVVVMGRLGGPALVPVAVSKVPGTPLRSPFPGPERVPGQGRDGERRVTPQVRQEQGSPPHDLRKPFQAFAGNGRNRHTPAVVKPPRREISIGPWHDHVACVEALSHPDAHIHRSCGARAALRGMVSWSASGGSQWREPDDS